MAEIDTILDDQEVTAEILNDIALDLGATSFNGFGENKFGADELNGITSALVSSGILSSGDKCEPYISGGKVYIKPGTIVFSNGAKKKITNEDVALDLILNSYIYALNDTVLNTCKIIVSQTAPSDGDYVNIAEISANGSLVDKRTIAKAKVELPSEGNSYVYKETISEETFDNYDNKTLTFPLAGVKKIFIRAGEIGNSSKAGFSCMYEYDISTQAFTGVYNREINTNPPLYETIINESEVSIFSYAGSHFMGIHIQVSEQTTEHVTFSFKKYVSKNGWSRDDHEYMVSYYVFGGVER